MDIFPDIAIGIGHTNPVYHATPINATKEENPQKRPELFEICDKANKVDYKILLMPEGHNPRVFGAVMRTPTDGLINIKFSMASTDAYANGIHIGLKERARECSHQKPVFDDYL